MSDRCTRLELEKFKKKEKYSEQSCPWNPIFGPITFALQELPKSSA